MNYQGPGRYQHYKGGIYNVLGLALQEDTVAKPDQPDSVIVEDEIVFVIYEPCSAGSLLDGRHEQFWARHLGDFNAQLEGDEVEIGGPEVVPRFVKLEG